MNQKKCWKQGFRLLTFVAAANYGFFSHLSPLIHQPCLDSRRRYLQALCKGQDNRVWAFLLKSLFSFTHYWKKTCQSSLLPAWSPSNKDFVFHQKTLCSEKYLPKAEIFRVTTGSKICKSHRILPNWLKGVISHWPCWDLYRKIRRGAFESIGQVQILFKRSRHLRDDLYLCVCVEFRDQAERVVSITTLGKRGLNF